MILVLLPCCIIPCLLFIVMITSKNASSHHLADHEIPPTPSLDYDSGWITELKDLSTTLGKPTEDILSMRWNSLQISVDFTEHAEVARFVREIPVDGKDILTEDQLNLLHTAIIEWLFCNGKNDRESYYRYLFESGEVLTEFGKETIHKLALKQGRPEVLDIEPLQQLVWMNHILKCDIFFQSLVKEGTRIKVFETATEHLLRPGLAIRHINGSSVTYFRYTTPPVSFEDTLRNKGRVLMADFEVYVAGDKYRIQPYFCRFWFDSENFVWRLKLVMCYPNGNAQNLHIVS